MKQIAYVLVGMFIGFILSGALLIVAHLPDGKPVALEPLPTKTPIEVHVVGAVVHPGLYALPEGSRVQDAITAAGGLLTLADPNSLNLAAKLQDGQQLNIPQQESAATASSGAAPFTVVPTSSLWTPTGDLVNINTASAEDLDALPGIGPTTANNIVDYRKQHGPFTHIEDIMNVPGIGPSTFDSIQNLITV